MQRGKWWGFRIDTAKLHKGYGSVENIEQPNNVNSKTNRR